MAENGHRSCPEVDGTEERRVQGKKGNCDEFSEE